MLYPSCLLYTSSEAFGNKAYITKARVHLMKDLGTVLSPINAFLILQSLESLSLRVNQHCKNALEIAKFLHNHEAVSWVNYPGLEDNENHEMAEKYLNGNYGGIVGFGDVYKRQSIYSSIYIEC